MRRHTGGNTTYNNQEGPIGDIETLIGITETIRTTHHSDCIRDIMSPSTDNMMIGDSTGATHRTDTRDSTETDTEDKNR